MFPRLFAIALAFLAFSDVAFGRIGNSAPNVFAARPIPSNAKVGSQNPKGRSRSLSKGGSIHDSIEQLKPLGTKIWDELKEWKEFDAFGPEKKIELEFGKKKELDHKKKGPGKLRKLKNRRRLLEEEAKEVVKEPVPNFVIP